MVVLGSPLVEGEVVGEEGERLLAVHVEPVGADEVLLVEDCVVWTQEMEVLELKQGVRGGSGDGRLRSWWGF